MFCLLLFHVLVIFVLTFTDYLNTQYIVVDRPDTDLVGHMDGLTENPNGVELDDVLLNRNIEEILANDAWANEAA